MSIYIRYSEGKNIDYSGIIKYILFCGSPEKSHVLHKLKKTERKQEKKVTKKRNKERLNGFLYIFFFCQRIEYFKQIGFIFSNWN